MGKEVVVLFFVGFLCCVISSMSFTPADNYLIDCGSSSNTTISGRVFVADTSGSSFSISASQNILGTTNSLPSSAYGSQLYGSARIFTALSSYTFTIQKQGRHWIRLYFFPFTYQSYDLTTAVFSVQTQDVVLLNGFRAQNSSASVFKEFAVVVSSNTLTLSFNPSSNSIAFVSAIEVVSLPDSFFSDSLPIASGGKANGLSSQPLETVYRLNVGGPRVDPTNDTLWRTWVNDKSYLLHADTALAITSSTTLTYQTGGATQDTAPTAVYTTADMINPSVSSTIVPNVTWQFAVDPNYGHYVRMHFCDIASKAINDLVFNVYIGSDAAQINLQLGNILSALASPYYIDYAVPVGGTTSTLTVSVGPASTTNADKNASLSGLEIMRYGLAALNGSASKSPLNLAAIIGGVCGGVLVVIIIVLLILVIRRRRKKADQNSKTWVPIPIVGGTSTSIMSGGSALTISSLNVNFGFRFSLMELMEATNNFDEGLVVGVGGFGKVYKGKLQDGNTVAVKRGNPGSQQGLKEFLTEIDMLSKFRHRHLVSLIGYCDENSEMILVYEYMANGTLRSHLYGSDNPGLNWKQRLEICIGAARGLHYLHTGSTQGIIHRDVKSANILLDENLMAKVADFGLSKAGPNLDQTHVSTAVKGSFGYLDPEYFRRQQLTEKSDVYSLGVVLLEVLCARPAIDPTLPREKVNIAEWGMKWQKKGQLDQIIDPKLMSMISPGSLRKFGETIEKCLSEHGVDRPTMGDVLWNLEYALQLHEAAQHAEPDEDSANRIIELPLRLSRVDPYDNEDAHRDVSSSGEMTGLTTSNVFSQLMNTEGR